MSQCWVSKTERIGYWSWDHNYYLQHSFSNTALIKANTLYVKLQKYAHIENGTFFFALLPMCGSKFNQPVSCPIQPSCLLSCLALHLSYKEGHIQEKNQPKRCVLQTARLEGRTTCAHWSWKFSYWTWASRSAHHRTLFPSVLVRSSLPTSHSSLLE